MIPKKLPNTPHFISSCFLFATLLLPSFSPLDAHYTEPLKHAELLFESALYPEAALYYEKALQEFKQEKPEENSEISEKIHYQLALSHYHNHHYPQALETLKDSSKKSSSKEIFCDSLYLTALIDKELGKYENEITTLITYLEQGNKETLKYFYEAQWELGLAYFQLNQFPQAKSYFDSLSTSNSSNLSYAAQLYLAKIEFQEGRWKNSDKILSQLSERLPKDHLLHYELAYWRGLLFFELLDYHQASLFLEKAIPQRNPAHAEWYLETLRLLSRCYVKMGDHPESNRIEQIKNFDKAESIFKQLLTLSKDEHTYLGLGECYLRKGHRLKDEQALQQAEILLAQSNVFKTKEAQNQALLFRTEVALTYADRDKLYRQMTADPQENPLYAKAWYLRGLNDFTEGQNLLRDNKLYEAHQAFERAIMALAKSSVLFKESDPAFAGLAIKYQAEAYLFQNSGESLKLGLKTLGSLKNSPILSQTIDDQDEVFYLSGLAAARLALLEHSEEHSIAAEKFLQEQLVQFPEGKFAPTARLLLGTLELQNGHESEAKAHFLKVTQDFPNSLEAGAAFFWAARCAEALCESEDVIKNYRRQVFENYGKSPYAAEAYFNYYSYSDYLNGDAGTLKHLQEFPVKYPDSPFLLNAHYLIGLDYKKQRKTKEGKILHKRQLTAAIDAFQEVESAFERLQQKNLLPCDQEFYFATIFYRAALERALTNVAVAEESKGAKKHIYLEYAEDLFSQIERDFENPKHPLAQLFIHGEPFPSIQEETLFGLAKTFLKAQKDQSAEKTFNLMLEKYQAAKITRGYFLSQTWYALAQIEIDRKNFQEALKKLAHAEDAGKGKILSIDEKLNLWIQQGLCLQALHQMDQAMLIFSQVINEDAASNLRLKAMYLRADIYAMQGRHELARKQLEATAKKGGEWAQKAKEKLEKDYEYQ